MARWSSPAEKGGAKKIAKASRFTCLSIACVSPGISTLSAAGMEKPMPLASKMTKKNAGNKEAIRRAARMECV
jgi:hypothetical protein